MSLHYATLNRNIGCELWDGPVYRKGSEVIVVRQPFIFGVAIQESDFALCVVLNKIPLVLRLGARAGVGHNPVLNAALQWNSS